MRKRRAKRVIDPNNMDLRDWLKFTNTIHQEFSDLLKISRGYLQEIISGRKKPSKKLGEKILAITQGKLKSFRKVKNETKGLVEESKNEIVRYGQILAHREDISTQDNIGKEKTLFGNIDPD